MNGDPAHWLELRTKSARKKLDMNAGRLAAHWQILIGMVAGLLFGFLAANMGFEKFVVHWIKPLGTIFINLLKLIAVPMIITSLVKGIADIGDVSRLSKMGLRTVALYLVTTVIAVSVGLLVVNAVKPGSKIDETTRSQLEQTFKNDASKKIEDAETQKTKGPLQPIVDIVPGNIFGAATSNGTCCRLSSSLSFSALACCWWLRNIKTQSCDFLTA